MVSFLLAGEGPAARAVLEFLRESGAKIAGVFTDSAENGQFVQIADQAGIKVYDSGVLRAACPPCDIKAGKATWFLNVFSPVIVAEGFLAPFAGRALNVHNGSLPEYAGIHVTQWAIRNGETETAAVVHRLTTAVDGGDIIAERRFCVAYEDTGLSLFVRSARECGRLMIDVAQRIIEGENLIGTPQDPARRHVYRHRDALDRRFDWTLSAEMVRNFVRAGNYRPFRSPTYTPAITTSAGAEIEILAVRTEAVGGHRPGTVIAIDETGPLIACGDGAVRISEAFCNGSRVASEDWSDLFADDFH